MLFVDYIFNLLPDGSIMMDEKLSAKTLNVKNGEKFAVLVNSNGTIIFKKMPEDEREIKRNTEEFSRV